VHRVFAAGCATVALVWMTACTGGGESTNAYAAILPPDLRNVDLTTLGDSSQLEAVADGDLTPAEYERALTAFVACMMEQGLEFRSAPSISDEGDLTYQVFAGRSEVEIAATERVIDECRFRHVTILERIWAWQQFRDSQQERNDARRLLSQCLRERNIDAPELPDDASLADLLETHPMDFQECMKRAFDESGATGL